MTSSSHPQRWPGLTVAQVFVLPSLADDHVINTCTYDSVMLQDLAFGAPLLADARRRAGRQPSHRMLPASHPRRFTGITRTISSHEITKR